MKPNDTKTRYTYDDIHGPVQRSRVCKRPFTPPRPTLPLPMSAATAVRSSPIPRIGKYDPST